MTKKTSLIKGLVIFFISIFITLFLANKSGKQTELFTAKIYQNISGKKPQHFQYDSSGVIIVNYGGKIGKQYNPVAIAENAIKWYNAKDTAGSRIFFSSIKWLTDNYTILNDSSIIYSDYYDWPGYRMIAPWRSAMNQGRAIQAFIKAYERTNDTIYLNLARRSMNTLYTEVCNGGVTYKDTSGYWYEEYADDNVPQSRVLNGMIVVLQALSDYQKVTQDPSACFLFTKGVESVKRTIHLYDNNGHSNYDISGKPASAWYHKFHTEQLGFLYDETREQVFNEYRLKWEQYREPSYIKTLYRKPTNIGIFTVFSIFAAVFTVLFVISYFLWFRKRKVE